MPDANYLVCLVFDMRCLHILVTGKCNKTCTDCFYRSDKELSKVQLSTILERASRERIAEVAIGGGEPLMHKNIIWFSRSLNAVGARVNITTNGTLLLDGLKCDSLHISYDKMHGLDFENLRKAVEYYKPNVGRLGLNHIFTGKEGLDAAVYACNELGIKDLLVILWKRNGKGVLPQDLGYLPKAIARYKTINFYYDSCLHYCLLGKNCQQRSVCVNPDFSESKCSNAKDGVCILDKALTTLN